MTYFNYTPPQHLGWECPKCGSCYSPKVYKCASCSIKDKVDTLPLCTCHMFTGYCPVHYPGSYTYTKTSDSVEFDGEVCKGYPAEAFYDEDGNLNPISEPLIPYQQDSTYKEGVEEFASKLDDTPQEIRDMSGVPDAVEKPPCGCFGLGPCPAKECKYSKKKKKKCHGCHDTICTC